MSTEFDSANGTRWPCRHEGCDKSFARKEHLNRHVRHHANSSYECPVCGQRFNRSDSLQRHRLQRHAEQFQPRLSGRSKKACQKCHKTKIKCDGAKPCSRCQSKGIYCTYDLIASEVGNSSHEAQSLRHELAITVSEQQSAVEATKNGGIFIQDEPLIFPGVEQSNVSQGLSQIRSSILMVVSQDDGIIDWLSMKLQSDMPSVQSETPEVFNDDESLVADGIDLEKIPSNLKKMYLDVYFTDFHHRWGFVHRPTYQERTHLPLLESAMRMIGAWLFGDGEGKINALAMHNYLMKRINLLLEKKSSNDDFQGSLSAALCQAALLNIIFTLYCGIEKLLSRAVVLHSTLLAILREVGFFNLETFYSDQRPGYFRPLHSAREGERQKLAAYLFKIDNYLSILRDQPSLMTLQELHFTLPCTIALFNSDNLPIWEARAKLEPAIRSQVSMIDMIEALLQDSTLAENGILVEDIQLALCAMEARMRHHTNTKSRNTNNEFERNRESLSNVLHLLMARLRLMSSQGTSRSRDEENLSSLYYVGSADQCDAESASKRAQALVFDSLMLCHLLLIRLNTDVRLIKQIVKDRNVTGTRELSEQYQEAQGRRIEAIGNWTNTTSAETALRHGTEILNLFRNYNLDPLDQKEAVHALDPIAYIALSTSSLVMWAFGMFSIHQCNYCMPDSEDPHQRYLEIDGTPICICRVNTLVAKFRADIPDGWEPASTTLNPSNCL